MKTEDGKYALSSLGEAAVSMMSQVEEPPKAPLHVHFPSKKWKFLIAALLVGFILLSRFFYVEYQSLSDQYSSIREDQQLLQEVLRDSNRLGGIVMTYEHKVKGTIATALLKNETATVFTNGTAQNETMTSRTAPWGSDYDDYSIYSLTGNSTLELRVSFRNPDRPQVYLFMSVMREIMTNDRSYILRPLGWAITNEPWDVSSFGVEIERSAFDVNEYRSIACSIITTMLTAIVATITC